MLDGPLVSVLMPVFNGERWIRAAIESCLTQSYPHIEVLVYDDCCADGTASIVRSFGPDRVRLLGEGKRFAGGGRNFLAEHARGDWIQLLDHDDYLLPEKIGDQVAFLGANPSVDFVFGPITLEFWEGDKVSDRRLVELPGEEQRDPWLMLAMRHIPQTGSPLMRRSVWREVGGHTETPRLGMELEYYSKFLRAGKALAYLPKPGAVYRLWGATTMSHVASLAQRLAQKTIYTRILEHLESRGELTPARLAAFSETLFRIAHRTMNDHPVAARELFRMIHARQPGFFPPNDLRPAYRRLYALGGWRLAEGIGSLRRTFRRGGMPLQDVDDRV